MKTQQYNNPALGCYFDGAFGQTYNDLRVLKLAFSYGYTDTDAQAMLDKGEEELTNDDMDLLPECVQDAEDYLNSLETRPFVSWRWYDGDFGLYADVDSAKEDCEFVSIRSLREARRMGVETDPEDSAYPPSNYEGEWLHINDHGNCTLYVRENGEDKEIWSVV